MKLMKRLLLCAFAMILAVGTSTTAFAAQADEMNNVQDTTVQYYVSGTYTIDIPEYIDVTYGASLYASELNISDTSYISVQLFKVPENGVYTLTHTSGSDTINIQLSGNNGIVTPSNLELARFDSSSNTSTSFSASLVDDTASLKAGAYKGTVTFNFMLYENQF